MQSHETTQSSQNCFWNRNPAQPLAGLLVVCEVSSGIVAMQDIAWNDEILLLQGCREGIGLEGLAAPQNARTKPELGRRAITLYVHWKFGLEIYVYTHLITLIFVDSYVTNYVTYLLGFHNKN